jgi:hypothetical protein
MHQKEGKTSTSPNVLIGDRKGRIFIFFIGTRTQADFLVTKWKGRVCVRGSKDAQFFVNFDALLSTKTME